MYDYELLPLYGGVLTAAVVPWLEIIAGLFLVVGIWRQAGLFVAGLLLLGFVVAQSFALYNGLQIACGCFGTHTSVNAKSISISAALMIICALAFGGSGKSMKVVKQPACL